MQEQAHQLEELQKHPGWEVLVDFLRIGMAQRQRQLIGGNVTSMDEYKRLCGSLQGTQYALDAAQAVRAMVTTEAARQGQNDDA